MNTVTARTILRSAALAGALATLSGCGSTDTIDVQSLDGTTALVSTGSQGGSDAEVRGVIQVGAGGCLGLLSEGAAQPSEGAAQPIPLIWPEGSKLTEAGDAVEVPDLGRVRIGQTISGGGGEVTNPSGSRYADIPDGCLDQSTLIEATTIKSAT